MNELSLIVEGVSSSSWSVKQRTHLAVYVARTLANFTTPKAAFYIIKVIKKPLILANAFSCVAGAFLHSSERRLASKRNARKQNGVVSIQCSIDFPKRVTAEPFSVTSAIMSDYQPRLTANFVFAAQIK
jgi:hypothetical protein